MQLSSTCTGYRLYSIKWCVHAILLLEKKNFFVEIKVLNLCFVVCNLVKFFLPPLQLVVINVKNEKTTKGTSSFLSSQCTYFCTLGNKVFNR